MPRQARTVSDTGFMHIIVRGIGKQLLFEETPDYSYYLWLLEKYSKDTSVSICGYCLMSNHVHLLVYDIKGNISLLMKKLGISYSAYYNRKYERIGHLFQDRFKSEAINKEDYFFRVLRYILNNPSEAGICPADEYMWSSYRMYGKNSSLLNEELLLERFGSFEEFEGYINADNDDIFMEYGGIDDDRAKEIIRKKLGAQSGTVLQSYEPEKRDEAIHTLVDAGMSIRQIERMTGISRGVIQKIQW